MKRLLWTSGVLAGTAVAFPGLILVGLYVGIVPGLVLAAAPTVFLYALTFHLLRGRWQAGFRASPASSPSVATNVAAALATAALGISLAYPFARSGRAAFEAADLGDVVSGHPVPLSGDIRLDRDSGALPAEIAVPRNGDWSCDALCAALLVTPGVRSVTLAGTDRDGAALGEATFRLVPRREGAPAGVRPVKPESILDHLPEDPAAHEARGNLAARMAARDSARNAIAAEWTLRLAGESTLVREAPLAGGDLAVVLQKGHRQGEAHVVVSKVEIRDRDGNVLLRRQRVTAEPVAIPLYLIPDGSMMDSGFTIARTYLHTGPRYVPFQPVETLFEETTLQKPKGLEGGVEEVRARIGAALVPDAPSGDLAMVSSWTAMLDWENLAEADVDLLASLVVDPRVTDFGRLYDGYAKKVAPRLRTPLGVRLNDASTPPRLRYALVSLLAAMPAGTFRTLTPQERRLLDDPALRLESAPLVERLADGGAAAVPMLVAMLQQDVRAEPWAKRWQAMEAYCRAFTRLGAEASSALPVIERLFREQQNPLVNEWQQGQAWRVAMVRMGKPVEELPFPASIRGEELERDREAVRRLVERAANDARP